MSLVEQHMVLLVILNMTTTMFPSSLRYLVSIVLRANEVDCRRQLTMNSLDLGVCGKSILPKLAANATLLVTTEWDAKVAVL
jgi:hypothetical protein